MIIKVELTKEEWQLVLAHLAQGRYIEVAKVIEKVAQQVKAADTPEAK